MACAVRCAGVTEKKYYRESLLCLPPHFFHGNVQTVKARIRGLHVISAQKYH